MEEFSEETMHFVGVFLEKLREDSGVPCGVHGGMFERVRGGFREMIPRGTFEEFREEIQEGFWK